MKLLLFTLVVLTLAFAPPQSQAQPPFPVVGSEYTFALPESQSPPPIYDTRQILMLEWLGGSWYRVAYSGKVVGEEGFEIQFTNINVSHFVTLEEIPENKRWIRKKMTESGATVKATERETSTEELLDAIARIKEERRSLLEASAKQASKDYSEGLGTFDQYGNAQLKLLEFQREIAATMELKRATQHRIVEFREKMVKKLEMSYQAGAEGATAVTLMAAREALLAARQQSLELKGQQ